MSLSISEENWYTAYSGGGYLLDYNMGWSEAYPVVGY